MRAPGATVLDLGCNRGMVCVELARNGARLVHGAEIWPRGVEIAREIFADIRNCESKFEVCDLTQGPSSLKRFGPLESMYDIVVMLATYHKIKRAMAAPALDELMAHIGRRTARFFVWRGPNNREEADAEIVQIDRQFKDVGLVRVHTSYLSKQIGPAAIWERIK